MDETDAFGKGEKGQRVTKPRSPTRKTAAWSTRRGSEQPTLNVKTDLRRAVLAQDDYPQRIVTSSYLDSVSCGISRCG